MRTQITSDPRYVNEALFGIGLAYGLTSHLARTEDLYEHLSITAKLINVSKNLAHKQGGHNKFLETITLSLDIKAPRFWWQEFDTYRVGVTKHSESTMHTITYRLLTQNDFEGGISNKILAEINRLITCYQTTPAPEKERYFREIKTALPEGFLQRRIVTLNIKTLQNIYNQRKNHRLPQWAAFFSDIYRNLEGGDIFKEIVRYYIFGGDCKV